MEFDKRKETIVRTLLFLFFMYLPSICYSDQIALMQATVRLRTPGTCTGIIYREDNENLYIMSAGHCASHTKTIDVQLYTKPEASEWATGDVMMAVYDPDTTQDISVIKIKKSAFGTYPTPKPINLAAQNSKIKINDEITSCGCSDGNWPTLFRGFIESITKEEINVSPNIKVGRSGSGLFSQDGKLIGIVVMTHGACVSLEYIYELVPKEYLEREIELPKLSITP